MYRNTPDDGKDSPGIAWSRIPVRPTSEFTSGLPKTWGENSPYVGILPPLLWFILLSEETCSEGEAAF
jgi:hypothetical protein